MSDILPRHWKVLDSSRMVTKFDNLGNALLHALDEILCGSSNYRPLIPATPTFHDNCSVTHHPARSHLLACSALHLERLYCAKYVRSTTWQEWVVSAGQDSELSTSDMSDILSTD